MEAVFVIVLYLGVEISVKSVIRVFTVQTVSLLVQRLVREMESVLMDSMEMELVSLVNQILVVVNANSVPLTSFTVQIA